MNNRDRLILLTTLILITAIIVADLIIDFREGVAAWHILIEGIAGLLALGGIFYIIKDLLQVRQALNQQRRISATLRKEAEQWRSQSKVCLEGLSKLIDQQLTSWNLTPAEREVAFLLLKGLSLKEIAAVRNTTEKTARVQSMAVYAKAGLSSRAELSAFFLEDLLPATAEADSRAA
ncbi:helix-turn-helix transcriptional regulator [Alteromonas facilis]|uniref:helix-turn-helix transcriptional regulator n=1 Tax=Alteromonas facilis TaxID=2048004 RepID=UPI000C2811EE|nr:LuxR C-terminal-related transcriptional regulator [Alteromonas facilis]